MTKPATAATHAQQGKRLHDQAMQAFERKGGQEEGLRLTREALAEYQAALLDTPGDGEVLCCIGVQQYNLGRKEEAVRRCDEVLAMDPKNEIALGVKQACTEP